MLYVSFLIFLTGINGFVYGNMPQLKLCVNQTAYFYPMTAGGLDNVHSFNILGQLKHFLGKHMGTWLLPGVFKTESITASQDPGKHKISSNLFFF